MRGPNLNRIFRTFLVFFIALGASSCLEIVEDVTLRADGSGKMKLTINLSRSRSEIDKLMAQDSISGVAIPKKQDIQKAFRDIESALYYMEGIQEVDVTHDFDQYIFTVAYEFANVEVLNQSFKTVVASLEGKTEPSEELPVSYNLKERTWSRTILSSYLRDLDSKIGGFGFADLRSSKITTIYRFDQEVEKSSFSGTRISKSGKSTMTQTTLGEAIANPDFHHLSITTQ